ncbi:META domain-containing protein [Leucobacter sp. wl10]|uniref:META domain-containing protein n=1 Tax=Leucobacter sp. wl10 TaxID=2304677 RepID=UPI0013C33E83|nr:META domain-containing protein [Leucobacter sp. wl10]
MSAFTHTLGVVGAGVLAFGAVLAASQLTTPLAETGEQRPPAVGAPEGGAESPAGGSQNPSTARVDPSSLPLEEAVLGRWRAPEPANQDAFIELTEYGLWIASDGCNSSEGTWQVDADGALTVGGAGAMTQVGCDNEPLPEAMRSARSVELDNEGRLILTDETGVETVLERRRETGISLAGRWIGPASATASSIVDFSDDGAWRATVGCHEFFGTWTLERNGDNWVEPPPGGEGVTRFSTAPGLLSIGPAPSEPTPECLSESAGTLALDYDTRYWFGFSSPTSFAIAPVDTAALPERYITFFRTEPGRQPYSP